MKKPKSKKPTQQELKRRLANTIAREVFTAGFGKRASRLELIDEAGRALGGWSDLVVRDLIERHLEKFLLAKARGR